MPGLEGWQVGTKVWLVLDGATEEGHLTWNISTGMVAHLGGGASWRWPAAQEDAAIS